MKKWAAIGLALIVVAVLILALWTGSGAPHLIIFHAGSLAVPFEDLSEEFNETHPDVKIERESAGSRTTVRKVTELGRPADIVAVSDYTVIEELMFPDFADWYIKFATNQMVIAYTEQSKYADEIDETPWYDILLREDVNYGRSDEDADPCGYRTLMVWKLAKIHYNEPDLYQDLLDGCPEKNIRPKETDLIPLLEAGELDYAFNYRSVAQQHGLEFLELPTEIDLSSTEFEEFYTQAQVEVSGKEPGETVTKIGEPIFYAVTIPKNAPHPELAIEYLGFLLGEEGQAVMEGNGQPPIVPALYKLSNEQAMLPDELKEYVAEAE